MAESNKSSFEFIPQIKAVVLDMDGVLVDTEPLHMKAFAMYLDKLGISYDQPFLQSLIGYSIIDNIRMIHEQFYPDNERSVEQDVRQRDRIYVNLLKATPLEPIEGIVDLLKVCQRSGIKTALASSSDKEQVDIIIQTLRDLNLTNRLKSIVCGSDVNHKKPDPEIYLRTLENLCLSGKDCLAIEDSDAGVASAKAAGLICLALRNPYTQVHLNPKADGVIDDIGQVAKAFQKLK